MLSEHDAALVAATIQLLADKLRQMQYDESERSHRELSPGYRFGWNDAAREAVATVLGTSVVEVKL